MVRVEALSFTTEGISGAVRSEALRHVLIIPNSTLEQFQLKPGDLRENIVLDDTSIENLHSLPSGTVLNINGVLIRLTVHCEPCNRIASFVKPSAIRHKRGYLGTVVAGGTIRIGDHISSLGVQYESIPYELKERIIWYLNKQTKPVAVTKFVLEIGLSLSACRAVPNMIKDIPGAETMILFKNRKSLK